MEGRIINLNGGVYKVLTTDNTIISLKARGKLRCVKKNVVNDKSLSNKSSMQNVKFSPKVGDIAVIDNDMIMDVKPRKNELIRPDIANVDQILLIFAAKEPDFSFYLLDLFLVNILRQKIDVVIVVTKIDKLSYDELKELKTKLSYYSNLGYKVLYVNGLTKEGIDEVNEVLDNKITVLSGQTGAGKSTLINALIPEFVLKTQEISKSLNRGKHTTREVTLYQFKNGFVGDTPGFSKLDLSKVKKEELASYFIEFRNYHCFFKDCSHKENIKGCMVHKAVLDNEILESRYNSYLRMYKQIEEK